MNKRLLAVAVAGALAAPAAAFAQSSVTISGVFKGSFENMKYGNFANAGTIRNGTPNNPAGAPGNASQTGVADDSSRIIFNVTEDLGGGLQAIGQYDFRGTIDAGGLSAGGNDHVGLRSKTWGRIFIGRQDLHYFNRESDLTTRGSLRADSISLLAYAGGGGTAIAGATRTTNVVHYTSPNWGGFTVIAAYSNNPTAPGNDIANTTRKGSAWNLNPNFQGSNWQIGWSHWRSKSDGNNAIPSILGAASPTVANTTSAASLGSMLAGELTQIQSLLSTADQKSDRLYGSYRWGGLKVGLAWDRSKLTVGLPQSVSGTNFTTTTFPLALALVGLPGTTVATGTVLSNRTVWSIPVSYTWGPHSINAHFDKARNDRGVLFTGSDSKASMFAISYGYDLSKRTSVALTYARINNGAAASYRFFTSGSLGLASGSGGFGAANSSAAQFGEDPRLWSVTMRHQF